MESWWSWSRALCLGPHSVHRASCSNSQSIPLIHKLFDERVYPSRNKERSLHYSSLNSNPSYHIVLSRKREIFMIIVVFHDDDFAHREER
jgi:hypothetical protein